MSRISGDGGFGRQTHGRALADLLAVPEVDARLLRDAAEPRLLKISFPGDASTQSADALLVSHRARSLRVFPADRVLSGRAIEREVRTRQTRGLLLHDDHRIRGATVSSNS